ncbi:hypothetical protein L208DRAFT_1410442 [Tricholoma matsutake]|nr:hypothetical protein L208DRAFT_1410442 [Tricholoma matsutake 945]
MRSDQERASQYEDRQGMADEATSKHPSSLCTVPVLSHTHHHLFRARLSRSCVRHRRNSVGCRRKAYVHLAAAYLPSNVALVLERIKDTDDS